MDHDAVSAFFASSAPLVPDAARERDLAQPAADDNGLLLSDLMNAVQGDGTLQLPVPNTLVQGQQRVIQHHPMPSHVLCNQPPWRMTGCTGRGQIVSGCDEKKMRYTFQCSKCGDLWNQLRLEKIGADGDPHIKESKRALSDTDPVRCGGYECKLCGLKRNKKRAQANGLPFCVCNADAKKLAKELPRRTRPFSGLPPGLPALERVASSSSSVLSSTPVHATPVLASVVRTQTATPPSHTVQEFVSSKRMRMIGGGPRVVRNASKKINCYKCRTALDDSDGAKIASSIGCLQCEHWACLPCAGVATDAYAWVCEKCN